MKHLKTVLCLLLSLALIICTVGCSKSNKKHKNNSSSVSSQTVSSEDSASSTTTEITSGENTVVSSSPAKPSGNSSASTVTGNSQNSSTTSSKDDYIWENGVDTTDPSSYYHPMSMLTITIGLNKTALKRLIYEMSLSGVDALFLGIGGDFILDDMSITTEYGTYTLEWFLEGRRFKQSDMDEILEYAKKYKVEIIPTLQTPGHMSPFLSKKPEWKYPGANDSLDLTNPEATAYMHAAYKKYGEYFAARGCKYFSVSADEWGHDFDKKGYDYIYNNGDMQYFVDYMNTNIENLSNLGFEVMAWNDGICYNSDVTTYGKIDTRLIVLYWSPGWFGNKFATPTFLEEQGYRIVNSYHTYYIESDSDLKERESKLYQFNFWLGDHYLDQPFGGMCCIWARPRDNDGGLTTVKSLVPILDALSIGVESWKFPVYVTNRQ